MQIDPDFIIRSIEEYSHVHYRDGNAADRLAWQVGALAGKIRELSALLQYKVDQLKQLQKDAK